VDVGLFHTLETLSLLLLLLLLLPPPLPPLRSRRDAGAARPTAPSNGEQTHSCTTLFPFRSLFFAKRQCRNKNRQPVVLPRANPHKTHWSSS
jgi:hypothetical protein